MQPIWWLQRLDRTFRRTLCLLAVATWAAMSCATNVIDPADRAAPPTKKKPSATGTSTGAGTSDQSDNAPTTMTIGPAGGTISMVSGAARGTQLVIPPGALTRS